MSSITQKPDGSGIIITVRITLNYGRDDALIDLVRRAPARGLAARIRDSMRTGIAAPLPDPEEDEEELDLSGMGVEL